MKTFLLKWQNVTAFTIRHKRTSIKMLRIVKRIYLNVVEQHLSGAVINVLIYAYGVMVLLSSCIAIDRQRLLKASHRRPLQNNW